MDKLLELAGRCEAKADYEIAQAFRGYPEARRAAAQWTIIAQGLRACTSKD